VAVESEADAVGLWLRCDFYLGDDTRGSWGVAEQGQFPEVGAFGVVHDFGRGLSGLQHLHGVGLPLGQKVEHVAFVALRKMEKRGTSWMISTPALNSRGFTASMTFVSSYGSMVLKIFTVFKKASYRFLFLLPVSPRTYIAASLTMCVNV
jgi:hypothetical protein